MATILNNLYAVLGTTTNNGTMAILVRLIGVMLVLETPWLGYFAYTNSVTGVWIFSFVLAGSMLFVAVMFFTALKWPEPLLLSGEDYLASTKITEMVDQLYERKEQFQDINARVQDMQERVQNMKEQFHAQRNEIVSAIGEIIDTRLAEKIDAVYAEIVDHPNVLQMFLDNKVLKEKLAQYEKTEKTSSDIERI